MPLRAGWASRTIVQLGWMIMKGPGALYGGSILSHKDHATNGEGTKQFIACQKVERKGQQLIKGVL
ncbi:hypothetical protein SERLADRAFT_462449 [Serpula lacrymans var. lacrymans S7.9]|uniref:Uncharacterized protein n=1 Tax=Serpula lacrymans var. lacrymans (strain S7.9) TaxID=578457 RepID=F8NNH5_SERL9|nr:uncharacterized protein SERLADRAFT_462449 [Serpula lacrymans var. lacrymans S7.9]EGO28032.1 hypothetical protein SERLADRAFT_462449 [Serpula lacrymans var. lacrymans S7.9]